MISFINYASAEEIAASSEADLNIAGFADARLKSQQIHCEVGAEPLVLALLCSMAQLADFDLGFYSAESCVGEEEAEAVLAALERGAGIYLSTELASRCEQATASSADASIIANASALAAKYDVELKIGADIYKDTRARVSEPQDFVNYDGVVVYSCLKAPGAQAAVSGKISAGGDFALRSDDSLNLSGRGVKTGASGEGDFAMRCEISPAAAKYAAARRLNLAKFFGTEPVQNPALKGLFILTPRRCGYPFALLKENECK